MKQITENFLVLVIYFKKKRIALKITKEVIFESGATYLVSFNLY